jgi:peptidoglycan/LPS O-acetylase OafA/YrhL
MNYRAEIDGLRATAVLSVIIYHAHFNIGGKVLLQGGYLGVDVFFVISGFLITKAIDRELRNNTFSISTFYKKRVKRIVPVYISMLILTHVLAWFYLSPKALLSFAKSCISSLLFASNILFWSEDSYVSISSLYKPLLHTWSLSVEEQYYLIYPLLMYCLTKKKSRFILVIFALFAGLSLLSAELLLTHHRDAAFFLFPFRIWELLIGASLVYLPTRPPNTNIKRVTESHFLSYLGFVGLIIPFFMFRESSSHPGVKTLLPVLGTALIIYNGQAKNRINQLLSSKPFISVGLISYSLYLWHQPIFVFARIFYNEDFSNLKKLFVALICLPLSYLSWRFIEKPVRYCSEKKDRVLLSVLGILSTFLGLFSLYIIATGGVPKRLPEDLQQYVKVLSKPEYTKLRQGGENCRLRPISRLCRFGSEKWILLGDSHAGVLAPAFFNSPLGTKEGGIVMSYEQCPFTPGYYFELRRCVSVNEERLKFIENLKQEKNFIIAAATEQFRRGYIAKGDRRVEAEEIVQKSIDSIESLLKRGHRVYLLTGVPNSGKLPLESLQGRVLRTWGPVDLKNITIYSKGVADDSPVKQKDYKALVKYPKFKLIRTEDLLCESGNRRQCFLFHKSQFLYTDSGGHISRYAADQLIRMISKHFYSKKQK